LIRNESQVSILSCGGNKKLREFLKFHSIPRSLPKKQLYSSRILTYYRKMLKAESNNEMLLEDLPEKREMLDPYTSDGENNFGKSMINISNDHYAKSFNSIGSSSGDKYTSISSSYNNDARFASVSSEPISKDDEESTSNSTTSSKLLTMLGVGLGAGLSITKQLAYVVKDKVSDMDLGSKLGVAGGKTVEALKYTGSKVYEKSSDFIVI
jgi:hypothetical protein